MPRSISNTVATSSRVSPTKPLSQLTIHLLGLLHLENPSPRQNRCRTRIFNRSRRHNPAIAPSTHYIPPSLPPPALESAFSLFLHPHVDHFFHPTYETHLRATAPSISFSKQAQTMPSPVSEYAAGALFGGALFAAGVFAPSTIVAQMRLEDFTMVKAMLGASATSA